jgi:hypothetical protein
MFTVYLLLVDLPFGIITALAARATIGDKPSGTDPSARSSL